MLTAEPFVYLRLFCNAPARELQLRIDELVHWLVAIKDHIASSLMIEQDDFEYAQFNQLGGIGRAYELFGDRLAEIMEEVNARLAA